MLTSQNALLAHVFSISADISSIIETVRKQVCLRLYYLFFDQQLLTKIIFIMYLPSLQIQVRPDASLRPLSTRRRLQKLPLIHRTWMMIYRQSKKLFLTSLSHRQDFDCHACNVRKNTYKLPFFLTYFRDVTCDLSFV